MSTKRITGLLFERMVRVGLARLKKSEKEINALNVFPVADGDTGTNMCLTLENGIRHAQQGKALNEYLKGLSSGMLLGARGNSGVILSQLFKGIYLELSRASAASPIGLRNAFIRGYKVAYESVIKPVEGTILTVAREGIEGAMRRHNRPADAETLLEDYLDAMEICLADTPNLLPVLKESGVVDSGGKGYIAIVRGMYECLTGEVSEPAALPEANASPSPQLDLSKFDENSDFNEGYCTEFILQLMKKPGYSRDFSIDGLQAALEEYGDSLVIVRDGMRVKVHVHTKTPAPIISYAQRYGEFLTFKLENMQLQHNEYVAAKPQEPAPAPVEEKHRPVAIVAVVNGEGNRRLFRDLGCARIIDGGATMNASAQEFLGAIQSLDADAVVILPCGPNMLLAAQQAVELSGASNVHILPAKTLAEGYYALAMDMQDSTDCEKRIGQMRLGIESIETLLIAHAVKAYKHNDVSCRENEYIAVSNDEVICHSEDPVETVLGGLEKLDSVDERECLIFFRGANADAALESTISERVAERWPLLEVSFEWGGQEVYDWVIGVM